MGVYFHHGKYYIDFYYQGKRIREKVGTNERKANKMLAVRQGMILQGRFSLEMIKPTPYFEDFDKEYLEWAKVNHRSCETMDAPRVKSLLRFFKGKRLSQINEWLINQFKKQRKEEVSEATVNRDLAVLSMIFSLALNRGILRDHPMKGGKVKMFREESKPKWILSEEEEERLLSVTSGWFKDILILALYTGMRQGELVNLKFEDIDLRNQMITVRNTKTGKDRHILMNQSVLEVLRARKESQGDTEYVFPKCKGKRPWNVRSAFVRACSKAKMVGLRFHDFRHTFNTYLLTHGTDVATLQRLTGHSDLRMLMRYSHPSSEDMKKAIRTLDRRATDVHHMDTKKDERVIPISNGKARDGHHMDTKEEKGLELKSLTP